MATTISMMELPFDFLHASERRRRLFLKAGGTAVFSVTSRQDVKTITSLTTDRVKTLRTKTIFYSAIITQNFSPVS
jgi:hypothetical protein